MEAKSSILIEQFSRALLRLDEVVKLEKNDIVRDSAIQRFEFCFDLAWKSLKEYLRDIHGVICSSPKSCFREAYRQGLIDYQEIWINMVDLRNETVHTYNQATAERVYNLLPDVLANLKVLFTKMSPA